VPTSYVECPECGKHALSVATRCPHCGFHFPPRPIVRPSPQRSFGASRGLVAVGGALLTLTIVALVVRHGRAGAARTTAPASPAADSVPATAPPAPARSPARSSTPLKGSLPAKAADRGAAVRSADPAPAVAGAAASAPDSTPTPAGPGIRRYAQTWVNVRGDRTRSAPAVGILNPGDAVTVDSLVRGWYRVSVDGRTLGYVHRSALDVSRPE
jgi:rRNA maturation protein Nop10